MKSNVRRVIVVLGMHRSGTSAVAYGLQALGVDLGRNLLPAQPDNPKGFWEDAGLLAINDKLLATGGMLWHSVGRIDLRDWDSSAVEVIRIEAIEYIQRHFAQCPLWGFKDPRTARLLPFWKDVFTHLGIDDSYAVTIRNPISVARSLAIRNGFEAVKSHLLWLDHMIASMAGCVGKRCVVVDYDAILASPEQQLKRIGDALGLRRGEKQHAAIKEFSAHFISHDLRHTVYSQEDLHLDPSVTDLTGKTYDLLLKLANDETSVDSQDFRNSWRTVENNYSATMPVLQYLEKVSTEHRSLVASNQSTLHELDRSREDLGERDQRLARLQQDLAERDRQLSEAAARFGEQDGRIAALKEALSQRDQQLANSHEGQKERDSRLGELNGQLVELKQQIVDLEASVVQREQACDRLRQKLSEFERQVTETKTRLSERDQELSELKAAVVGRDHQLARLQQERNERDSRLSVLNDQLVERKQRIADLAAIVGQRDQALTEMLVRLDERNRQIGELSDSAMQREQEHDRLHQDLAERERQILGLEDVLNSKLSELQNANRTLEQVHSEIADARSCIDSSRSQLESERSACEYYKNQNNNLLTKVLTYEHEHRSFGIRLGRLINRLSARLLPPRTLRGRLAHLARRTIEVTAERGVGTAYALGKMHLSNWFRLRNRSGPFVSPTGYLQKATPAELEQWIVASEPGIRDLERQVKQRFEYAPLISVILPVYKVPREILEKTLRSLMSQTYANWEACVAYADVGNDDNWSLIERLAQEDIRIRGKRLEINGGISINSNAALLMARGEFIALLDHDDELTPWAFCAMVERLNEDPEIDFLYSDKDSIDEQGTVRLNALFKPEWSPEMLYSVNYLTHLCLMRKCLVDEVGGWRPETDGAQDWDIFYRVTERSRKIARVPGIQYHWRIISTSTSTGLTAKPYAAQGQLRTQQDRIARLGLPAAVLPHPESGFHVIWDMARLSGVDVIVDGDVSSAQFQKFWQQLSQQKGLYSTTIKLVCSSHLDRSTVETTSEAVELHLFNGNEDKTRAMREAAAGRCDVLLFLSASVDRLSADSLSDLVGWAGCHPDIAFAGALALLEDETVVEAGLILNAAGEGSPLFRGMPLRSWGWLGGPLWYRNCSAISPFAVAFKRAAWEVGVQGSRSVAPNWRTEFLHRCQVALQARYRGMVDPHARIYFESMPNGPLPGWDRSFRQDPYFHPAFSSVSPLAL